MKSRAWLVRIFSDATVYHSCDQCGGGGIGTCYVIWADTAIEALSVARHLINPAAIVKKIEISVQP